MEKNSLGIILIGGLLSFILYKSDAIGGFGFFVCLIIIFVASAIVAGNAKSKKIMERGQLLNEKLNKIENFTATKKLIGNGNKYFIALDEGREKIVFLGDSIKKHCCPIKHLKSFSSLCLIELTEYLFVLACFLLLL